MLFQIIPRSSQLPQFRLEPQQLLQLHHQLLHRQGQVGLMMLPLGLQELKMVPLGLAEVMLMLGLEQTTRCSLTACLVWQV